MQLGILNLLTPNVSVNPTLESASPEEAFASIFSRVTETIGESQLRATSHDINFGLKPPISDDIPTGLNLPTAAAEAAAASDPEAVPFVVEDFHALQAAVTSLVTGNEMPVASPQVAQLIARVETALEELSSRLPANAIGQAVEATPKLPSVELVPAIASPTAVNQPTAVQPETDASQAVYQLDLKSVSERLRAQSNPVAQAIGVRLSQMLESGQVASQIEIRLPAEFASLAGASESLRTWQQGMSSSEAVQVALPKSVDTVGLGAKPVVTPSVDETATKQNLPVFNRAEERLVEERRIEERSRPLEQAIRLVPATGRDTVAAELRPMHVEPNPSHVQIAQKEFASSRPELLAARDTTGVTRLEQDVSLTASELLPKRELSGAAAEVALRSAAAGEVRGVSAETVASGNLASTLAAMRVESEAPRPNYGTQEKVDLWLGKAEELPEKLMQQITRLHTQALRNRFAVDGADAVQRLTLRLHPAELGQVEVQLRSADQLSLQFSAREGVTRDLLEQNLGRLRSMFEEQGIQLGDVEVGSQFGREDQQQAQQGTAESGLDLEHTPIAAGETPVRARAIDPSRLVDLRV